MKEELVIDIVAGEGGQDSKLFVEDLCSAYLKYAQNLGFKSELLLTANGHMVVKFIGVRVWQAFRHEPGKHVVQRCPPTESKGRRHTSTISVAVLPLLQRDFQPLSKEELNIETHRGTGAGGQHKNVTDSAVRITHIPTGIRVSINGRRQGQNKKEALRVLTARVNEFYWKQKKVSHGASRRAQVSGGNRSGKKRTYDFISSRVVDHELGTRTGRIRDIMRGRFELLYEEK